jgi:hypothetical protein
MSSAYTDSDPGTGNSQLRKRKHDGRAAGDARPPSSKHSFKSKTSDLNPVIITNALNSTLNRLADVMEKTLDVNATAIAPAAPPTTNAIPPTGTVVSSIVTPPIESQTTQLLSNPPSSSQGILHQAMEVITSVDTLSEDQLFAACLFFTGATEEAIRAAHTFIALGNNQVVRQRFLLSQLVAAGLLPGKGKGKAVEDGDDSMTY